MPDQEYPELHVCPYCGLDFWAEANWTNCPECNLQRCVIEAYEQRLEKEVLDHA